MLNKTGLFFCAVFLLFASLAASGAIAQTAKRSFGEGTPTRAIQNVDGMLDDFIVKGKGKELTPEEEEHNKQLKKDILHGTFDIHELARLSLGKHWGTKTPAEQDEFVQLLTDILEEKALFSKEQSAAKSKNGGKYTVAYRGEKYEDATRNRSFVRTNVSVPSERINIAINYRLKKNSNEWKVYDIVVDEASLVDNYRYQFDSIIKKHGYPDLVRRMKVKLTEIKENRK